MNTRRYEPPDEPPPRVCTPGRKDDTGKNLWHLLPWAEVRDVVRVLDFGVKKYAANNWQLVDNARDRYFAASMRHLVAWQMGEKTDSDSGLPHLAHAATCLLFLAWFDNRDTNKATDAKQTPG